MEIIYVSNSTIPSDTANSVHVMKMCQAFSNDGHKVTLYAKEGSGHIIDIFKYYGITSIFNIERKRVSSTGRIGSLIYSQMIKKHISEEKLPDIFYGRNISTLIRLSRLDKPIIYEAHAFPTTLIRKSAEYYLFKKPNFQRLIVISQALKEEYIKKFPFLKSENIKVAHDGADMPKKINIKQESRLVNMGKNIKVGYIGHLYSGRGIDIIVKLATLINEAEFHIVGGTKEDVNHWKSQTDNLDNIYFYGFVPNGELYKYYNDLDIMLAPYKSKKVTSGGKGDTSRWMSPLKLFEYMSYSKPMIVSDIPVLREILRSGSNCLLCSDDNIIEWKENLMYLIQNKKIREDIGENAFKDFKEKYTWLTRAQNVLK